MTEISDLPEDVIAKIWSLLPLKSVVRLKTVQKSWNILVKAMVRTPSFAADHLRNNTDLDERPLLRFTIFGSKGEKSLTLADWKLADNPRKVNAPQEPSPKRVTTISAHCDGMVCTIDLFKMAVKLWNPLTGELRRFPCLDSLEQNVAVGFGHDPVSGTYKVVVFHKLFGGTFEAKVCTVGEDTWRAVGSMELVSKLTGFARHHSRSAVCHGGVAYWNANIGSEDMLVSFDLGSEAFKVRWVKSMKLSLARWNGLVVMLLNPKSKNSLAKVWVMTDKKMWQCRFICTDPSSLVDMPEWLHSSFWDPSLLTMPGFTFFDLLERKYIKICSQDEKIDRISLFPHVEYSLIALP